MEPNDEKQPFQTRIQQLVSPIFQELGRNKKVTVLVYAGWFVMLTPMAIWVINCFKKGFVQTAEQMKLEVIGVSLAGLLLWILYILFVVAPVARKSQDKKN